MRNYTRLIYALMTSATERRTPRLREIREAQRKGLRETARRIGVDPAYLSRVERGLVKPSLGVLYRLAQELKLEDLAADLAPFVEGS
jgi:transcriptional regulator with XRE-family HTH domain